MVVPRIYTKNKAGHLIVFTQFSILNRDSPDVDENKSPFVRKRTERMEFHLDRKHPFWGFRTDLHYLGQSTDLETVNCYLLQWLTLKLVKNYHFRQLAFFSPVRMDRRCKADDPAYNNLIFFLIFFYRLK